MKFIKPIAASLLILSFLAAPFSALAVDAKADKDTTQKTTAKVKPYPLKTCVVSGDKLGGDMGKPYTFVYKGREIELCCKDCRKDFDKNPTKFIKKLEAAEKKAAK
jgi:YHS domain-containing protein